MPRNDRTDRICSRCGTRNQPDRLFCEQCGLYLGHQQHAVEPEDPLHRQTSKPRRTGGYVFWAAMLATFIVVVGLGTGLFVQMRTSGFFSPVQPTNDSNSSEAQANGSAPAAPTDAPAPTQTTVTTQAVGSAAEGTVPTPIPTDTDFLAETATAQTERQIVRDATGTASAKRATERSEAARTAVAQQFASTATAIIESLPSAATTGPGIGVPTIGPIGGVPTPGVSSNVLTFDDLPIYPGAERLYADDPFLQGVASSNIAVEGQRVEYTAYTIAAGETAGSVLAFYQNALAANGWQLSSSPPQVSIAGMEPAQQTLVWGRMQQRLIVTVVARETDGFAGKGYILVTMISQM